MFDMVLNTPLHIITQWQHNHSKADINQSSKYLKIFFISQKTRNHQLT